MSGIGPTGWSYSLNFANRLVAVNTGPAPTHRPGGRSGLVYLAWAILRLALGVDQGLIFELVGAFILSQTDYCGYDFKTHHKAHAIVFIGSIGGIAIGLVLLLIDAILGTRRAFADVEPAATVPAGRPALPNIRATRNQAWLRALIWPGLGAMGSVVEVIIWHLSQNNKPQPRASERSTTAAVVGAVGAAVTVTAPSILQLILLLGSGYGSGRK